MTTPPERSLRRRRGGRRLRLERGKTKIHQGTIEGMAQSSVPSRSSAYSIWWQQTQKSDGVLLRALDLARASEAREDVPVPSLPPTTLSLPPLITPFAMSLHDVKTAADFDAHLASSEFAACHLGELVQPLRGDGSADARAGGDAPERSFPPRRGRGGGRARRTFRRQRGPFLHLPRQDSPGGQARGRRRRGARRARPSTLPPPPPPLPPRRRRTRRRPPPPPPPRTSTRVFRALVTRAPVMLFMKGTRDEPRWASAAKVVAALAETAFFDTFDILSDEDVRQGLKTFSNWPPPAALRRRRARGRVRHHPRDGGERRAGRGRSLRRRTRPRPRRRSAPARSSPTRPSCSS